MKFILNLLCTISSLSLAPWIYFVKNGKTINEIFNLLGCKQIATLSWFDISWLSMGILLLLFIGIAYVCLCLSARKDSTLDIASATISKIEPAGEEAMLTYLGLFFYALSVPNLLTLEVSFALLCIGCFLTRRYTFNPLYLFFGYHYYNVHSGKKSILLITKEKYQFNDSTSFERLVKLNEFTFLEVR